MPETSTDTNDTIIIRAPGGPEIRWRTQRMISLGADPELAAEIAESATDLHDLDRLMQAGCPLELAWRITQPVGTTSAESNTSTPAANALA
jgi:hypothetical protein